jgi:hypothetical protein
MNSPIKLSVSSILLAGIMAGCSQQQIQQGYADNSVREGSKVSREYQVSTPKRIHKSHAVKKKKSTKKHKSDIGFPPAKLGQCYAKVRKPATYKTFNKRVLVKKATSKRVFVRSAQYQWINKRVLVRPASYMQRVIPAIYKTVTKRVMVKPSYLTWKKGKGLMTKIDNTTGEILCRVKIPAVYKKVNRKVLVRAAQTIKTPRPAVYKTVKQKKLGSPAQYKVVRTPARYSMKKRRVKTASAKYIWRQVICKTNVSKNYKGKIHHKKIHKADKKKTYKPKFYAKKSLKKYSKKQRVVGTKFNSRDELAQKRKRANNRQVSYSRRVVSPPLVRANMQKPAFVKTSYKPLKSAAKVKQAPEVRMVTKIKENKSRVSLTKANAIFRIQTALSERGFNPGKVDGKLGPATVAALTEFQRQKGLRTGKLNRATLIALNLI